MNVSIIIIIIIIISFMQGIYTYIPETNHVPREYVGGPKNNENFFLEGRGALVLPAPAWCVYVTARRISWPRGILGERSTQSV